MAMYLFLSSLDFEKKTLHFLRPEYFSDSGVTLPRALERALYRFVAGDTPRGGRRDMPARDHRVRTG
jgi:hypothetical protein